ncbi:amphi-Trp domain-containing protein [Nocardia sp. CDC153]|uniref:amphi-Trp domain-containing protein n=1 Tax=Nocardia sp. CDC153 TaxID=3112167 RepID=UPI002DC05E4B|nr:amphi-Trp domain-containing protein [Nocardia sp. CDC153]MEC3952912.1 amphi-Trp domain-containing protein [Nocardia sp. CDC153]
MSHHKIYEAHRTLDRVELANQLRTLADELDSGGVITYGSGSTAGTLDLPEKLRGTLKITHAAHGDSVKISARLAFPDIETTDAAESEPSDTDEDWETDDPYA